MVNNKFDLLILFLLLFNSNSKCTMFHSSNMDYNNSSSLILHILSNNSSSITITITLMMISTILSSSSIRTKNSKNTIVMMIRMTTRIKHSHSQALTAIDSQWKQLILKKKEFLMSTKIYSTKNQNNLVLKVTNIVKKSKQKGKKERI